MKVAAIQLEIKDNESKQQRMHHVDAMLEQLKDYDLVILPEIWATGYFSFDKYVEEAEELDGSFVQHYMKKAKELNLMLFAGSFVEREGNQFFNTSVLFSNEGEILDTYRKIHLFRYGSKEGEILTRGDKISVVDTKFGKIGLSTCYDMRFPELYRKQVDLGAEIFLVTAAWPHRRIIHWDTLNVARALENQCYVISCNCVGDHRGSFFGGHSQVVDPWGTVLAKVGDSETILKTEIDLSVIEETRERFPNLKHRVL
ncbi:carbon-nitrogen hydrolase [Pueribacillus theae]|uniref:Carbon-nitrogen hydrolase n=1 Tax=Pueribacillus theae TaxID=2171751 RepID=A0A2U1JHT1_9BACI|nr:carbon-nitrogen family hydrolase [Pueribacillus theae]PWA04681.1 carbon-nitrogen hydrolase [Pueribacillus theae]